MITKDFVKDIELYICEKFGYRNSVYVNPTCNGCCIDIREKDVKLYFRLWEYSKGVNGFPDRCIILVNYIFEKNLPENLLDLVRFFKEYAPLYGFHHLGIENDMRGDYRLLGLKPTTYHRAKRESFLPLFSFYSMIFYTFVNKTKIEGMDKPMNRIKEVLEERGIKQTWLAEKLGKSFCMVNAYVCNRRQPSLEVLFQIAEILKVDVKDLINEKQE